MSSPREVVVGLPPRNERRRIRLQAGHCLQWLMVMIKINYYFCLCSFQIVLNNETGRFQIQGNIVQRTISTIFRTLLIIGSLSYLKVYPQYKEEGEHLGYVHYFTRLSTFAGIVSYIYCLTKSGQFLELFNCYHAAHPASLPTNRRRWQNIVKARCIAILVFVLWIAYYVAFCLGYFLSEPPTSFNAFIRQKNESVSAILFGPLEKYQLQPHSEILTVHIILLFCNQLPIAMAPFAIGFVCVAIFFYGQLIREFIVRNSLEPYEQANADKFSKDLATLQSTVMYLRGIAGSFLYTHMFGVIPFVAYQIVAEFMKNLFWPYFLLNLAYIVVYGTTVASAVIFSQKAPAFVYQWIMEHRQDFTHEQMFALDFQLRSYTNTGTPLLEFSTLIQVLVGTVLNLVLTYALIAVLTNKA